MRSRAICSAFAASALALFSIGATAAHAAGFLIYDLSGEAMGKASAVSASTREPAAVWFNPAALTEMGHGVSLGSTLVLAQSRFDPLGGGAEVKTKPGRFLLPTAFATLRLHDRVSFGIGVVPAFGLSIEWPQDWIGREQAIKASIKTVNVNPALAIKLLPQLSLAVGFQAVRGAVDLTNGLPAIVGGTVQIGGATWGYGANAGLLYQPIPERLHFALTYRSRVKLSFNGRADFDPNPDFARSLPDQGGSAAITLPDILTAGVLWRPAARVSLTFDANVVFWSTYDRLVVDFENPTTPDTVMERNNHNAVTLRLGGEWATPAPGLALRAGFIFDRNPAPKETLPPSLPDANRLDFTLGVGYRWQWLKADLGYLLGYFLASEARGGKEGPEGTYHTLAQLLGVTVTATFGP